MSRRYPGIRGSTGTDVPGTGTLYGPLGAHSGTLGIGGYAANGRRSREPLRAVPGVHAAAVVEVALLGADNV